MCRLLRPRFAVPNDRIIRNGERGDAVFFIASGAVEVILPARRVRLGSGEFFGEMALLSGRPRQSDVVALTYCQLLVLRRADFERFMAANPEARATINRIAEARRARNAAGAGKLVRGVALDLRRTEPANPPRIYEFMHRSEWIFYAVVSIYIPPARPRAGGRRSLPLPRAPEFGDNIRAGEIQVTDLVDIAIPANAQAAAEALGLKVDRSITNGTWVRGVPRDEAEIAVECLRDYGFSARIRDGADQNERPPEPRYYAGGLVQ